MSTTIVSLGPEVTIPFAAATREQLLEALRSGTGELVLDLSGVTDFDSAGVQLLLSAQRSARNSGRALRLHQPSAGVRDALAVFGLGALLPAAAA